MSDLRAQAERWIADDPDPATQAELRILLEQPDLGSTDLADRFACALEFGTAGLRAVLGAGPNRMNRAVVARATWALARVLLASVPQAAQRGVVVGGDARRMSPELSEDVAAILAAAGLRVVLFRDPVPTPLLGFTVKRRGAAAGVVITASHNPPEYNGYKVYWENAAQIIPPIDARIGASMVAAPPARAIERPSLEALSARGLVTDAPAGVERPYLDAVRALAVHPTEGDRALRIVYTPLHGVGDALVRKALAEAHFTQVTSVAEQRSPDGSFPTVAFPNPEEPGAMDRAFALAKANASDLVLANDPDVDRLAVAVRCGDSGDKGRYRQLTGNEVGVLLGHYLLTERAATRPRVVLASIVSSPLLGRIAADLGVRYEETLTGFKWIANRAIDFGREGYEFVLGYEEALGYSVGDAVYDKDGISAAVLVAEVAAVLRGRGKTLLTELDAIARRWGVFTSTQVNLTRKGATGVAAIRSMMEGLRASPPEHVGGDAVVALADYQASIRFDVLAGTTTPLALPKSHVLTLELASGSRIIARPSGTEPKAKFYFDVREEVRAGEGEGAGEGAGEGEGAGGGVEGARARALAHMKRLAEAFVQTLGPSA